MTASYLKDNYRRDVLNRLKTARGHLDGIIRMAEDDTYCPDLMKQLSAVQARWNGPAAWCCATTSRPAWSPP